MRLKITLLCIAFTGVIYAQTTNVISTGLNQPQDLFFVGDDLYIANYGTNQILKADISVNNPTPVLVVANQSPLAVYVVDNYLFVGGNSNAYQRHNLNNISEPNNYAFNLGNISALAFNGVDNYIALKDNFKIKYNNNSNTQPLTDYINVTRPNDLKIVGTTMYIAEGDTETVSKVDLSNATPTLTNVITNIGSSTQAIEVLNDNLFIAVNNPNKIYRLDLTSATPVLEDVVTMPNNIGALRVKGNDLYIASGNTISKLDTNTLSVNEANFNESDFKLYPNPVTNILNIQSTEPITSLQLINIKGQVVCKTNTALKNLNMGSYKAGLYFLKIETEKGTTTRKVVKQ
ncbi:T9SS type A sorting domain-containing protein [uncultured Lacinutrix sp.]|uniref:T9SS type A sorting domain-containing protein n=1 Tax=uncultured Lacinutrix sp. TaxID=574032 RepID=UPI0026079B63|nr:T9SS type A sorting domain-containing protein [uncultured Lacinutrix sp.]